MACMSGVTAETAHMVKSHFFLTDYALCARVMSVV
jgi:hypothetical protein